MMIKNICARKWTFILTACMCVVVLLTSVGCAPLRKKFTRQKKKDGVVNDKFIPVLEPVEYAAKQFGSKDAYAQHYSLFKVWFSEFSISYQEAGREKAQIYDLEAALKEFVAMEQLLKSPALDDLLKVKKQLLYLRDELDKPKAFRNDSRIRSELRGIDRVIRKNLKLDVVEPCLVE